MDPLNPTKLNVTIFGGELYLQPDSLISVSIYSHKTNALTECCRIESSVYENNPNWPTSISIDYLFEVIQPIHFTIKNQLGLEQFKFSSTLAELTTKGTVFFECYEVGTVRKLKVVAKEENYSDEVINLHFKAHNVDKMDFFGKSDPYFVLSKLVNGNWVQVYKSEIVKKTLDPIWKAFSLTSKQFFDNNQNYPLKIDVFDWDMGTKDDFIGGFEFNYSQLGNQNCRFELINLKKQKKKKKYSNSGVFEVAGFQVLKSFSFIDYMLAGVKLSTIFGIDFTSSNQDFNLPTSLHNLQCDNFYEGLVASFANLLGQYDPSKLFPLFGFGGEPSWLKRLDHCFALNQSNISPYVHGVENLINTYKAAVKTIRYSGPTLISQVVSAANSLSSNFEIDKAYNILVIILDSSINDMYQTLSSLVQSSFLPLSVIFVAIGNDSFNGLSQLTDFPLTDEIGKKSVRKNTQLSYLREFGNNTEALVSHVLRRIPKEFEEYMKFIHYFP